MPAAAAGANAWLAGAAVRASRLWMRVPRSAMSPRWPWRGMRGLSCTPSSASNARRSAVTGRPWPWRVSGRSRWLVGCWSSCWPSLATPAGRRRGLAAGPCRSSTTWEGGPAGSWCQARAGRPAQPVALIRHARALRAPQADAIASASLSPAAISPAHRLHTASTPGADMVRSAGPAAAGGRFSYPSTRQPSRPGREEKRPACPPAPCSSSARRRPPTA